MARIDMSKKSQSALLSTRLLVVNANGHQSVITVEQLLNSGAVITELNELVSGDGTFNADVISELTAAAGVTIDGVLNKDGAILTTAPVVSSDGAVGAPSFATTTTGHGFYELSATQMGISVAGALASIFETDGLHTDGVFARVAKGTAGTNVTALEYGDGRNFTTELTLSAVSYTIAGAANEAVGALIYTLPAGAHLHSHTYHSVAFTAAGGNSGDTPDVGIGSAIGTGAVAVLGGNALFEDYVTGSAAADCSGTALVVGPIPATAGLMTGISLNAAADVKLVHLNMAAAWTGADTVTASGTITLKWTIMS